MSVHRNAKLGLAGRFALVQAVEGGCSIRSAATRFNVSPATAHRWWHRWLEAALCQTERAQITKARGFVGGREVRSGSGVQPRGGAVILRTRAHVRVGDAAIFWRPTGPVDLPLIAAGCNPGAP
jgi:hypothetical protein